MEVLSEELLDARQEELKGWTLKEGFLERTFVFNDFNETYGFIARVALLAEALQHHPDWSGTYRTVTLRLRTHDVDGITEKDVVFAKKASNFVDQPEAD
jgi:4a-hydroxytetrahydrobiopterin dehydratase